MQVVQYPLPTAADSTLCALVRDAVEPWEHVRTLGLPDSETQLVLFAQLLRRFFSQLDMLVSHAVTPGLGVVGIETLLHILARTSLDKWFTYIPWLDQMGQPTVEAAIREYEAMRKWSIGALSVALSKEEKRTLGAEYPELFGPAGSISKWF